MSEYEALVALAGLQHGVVGRRQLAMLDWPDKALRRWAGKGLIDLPTPRVVRVLGAPVTGMQRAMAAVLDAGAPAMVSEVAAGWLWRLPGFGIGDVAVTILRGDDTRRASLARLHRPRLLLPHHVTRIENIPVTSLARTIFDLAGAGLPLARLDRLVNTVVGRSPAMTRVLHRTLDELACRGRPGITAMRAVLADKPLTGWTPLTGLERRFEEVLGRAGDEPLEAQVNAGGEEWIGRVDFRDGRRRLLVEVDSKTFHGSVLDTRLDAVRDEALLAAGWAAVERVSEDDLWHRPWLVVEQIRRARRDLDWPADTASVPRGSGRERRTVQSAVPCQNEEG